MHSNICTCDILCLSEVPNNPYVRTDCRTNKGCVPPGIRGCTSQADNPEARCSASEIKRLHKKDLEVELVSHEYSTTTYIGKRA